MRRIALLAVLTGLFFPLLASAPAHAQASRTWVSGVGDDVNPCSRTAPCKTFAGAISKTAASGEINCLDPGGFGAVTITKAITISCEAGTAGITVSLGQSGIIVNAGANDFVTIRGLDIEGLGSGGHGIRFLAGAGLLVDSCTIRDFKNAGGGFGITHAPTTIATLQVVNTVLANNGTASSGAGIQVAATGGGFARAMLTRSTVERNFVGVSAVGAGPTSAIQVFQSAVSHNSSNGLLASGAGAVIKVGGSAIIGNGAAATSGNVLSFLNNEISDNSTDTSPASAGGLK